MKRLTPVVVLVITVAGVLASGAGVRHQSRQAAPEQSKSSRASASITGLVIGTGGEPVANAHVSLSGLNQLEYGPGRQTTAATDGSFEFANVARGVYTVTTFGLDCGPAQATCRSGDSVTLRVSISKWGVITGRVTDANGKPAIEAPVHAIRLRDSDGWSSILLGQPFEGLTDDRGVYRLWRLPAGTYILSAGARSVGYSEPRPYDKEAPTYFPSNSADTAIQVTLNAAEERIGVDIRMREWNAHTISGKVSGALDNRSDQGYFAVSLWAASTGQFEALGRPVIDQATGEFRFEALAAGDYCLQGLAGNRMELTAASAVTQVVVKDSDVTGLNLIVRPAAATSGRVSIDPLSASAAKKCSRFPEPVMEETLISLLPDGQPRQEAGRICQASSSLVNWIFAAAGGIARATPDARGEVSIKPLESGRYRIEVEPPNENYYLKAISLPQPGSNRPVNVARSGIEIKDGARVSGIVITLAPGAAALSGSVVPPQPGSKLPSGIIVLLVPADAQSQDDVLRFAETPVTSDGTFTFKNVAPGRYFPLVQQIDPARDIGMRRPWWDADTRAALRREAEKAKALADLKPCERVKNHVLVYSVK